MAAEIIGKAKAGLSAKKYDVKWDKSSRRVYVGWGGFTYIGDASSAANAMDRAEAWLSGKK